MRRLPVEDFPRLGGLLLLVLGSTGPAAFAQGGFPGTVDQALDFAAQQLDAAVQSIATDRYPSTTGSGGSWSTTAPSSWTSGFFPGSLWLMHEWSGAGVWRTRAEAWLVELEDEKNDTSTHDVGFKIFTSFGNGQRLTGSEAYRAVLLTAAGSLATRYSPTVGAIKSWNGPSSSDFRVIIDNMMNLELLFWGASHGGPAAWRDMAISHALRSRAEHVRADGSTYQVVNFHPSTGAVQWKDTHQGFAAESTWSRGQAWAVYGFTMCYRETLDARFLETARLAADYFVAHLPGDHVPYWDFELPSFVGEPRDSSAAAIAASGLLELARLEPDAPRGQTCLDAARAILTSLASSAYLAQGTSNDAILLHGTQNRPDDRFDTGLVYGDYYFVEALVRYLRWYGLEPAVSPLSVATQAGVPVEVVLEATDAQECELLFSIVVPPAHGTLGPLVGRPCQPGAFQRDTAALVYTPAPGFSGADAFSYVASDGVHASAAGLVSIAVGAGGGASTTFTCIADSKTKSTSPTTNYGTETTLRIRSADPEWRTFLKFSVTGIDGPVSVATLRLWVDTGSNDGGRVHAVGSGWTESGLTWNNAPALAGSALDAAGAVTSGAWVEYDVTDAVTGNGTVGFALASQSTTSCYFSSREGQHPPELVVVSGGAGPPALAPGPPVRESEPRSTGR